MFWVRWPEGAGVAVTYEVRVTPTGVETRLHVDGPQREEALVALDAALARMLAGLTVSGEPPRRARSLDERVACVHAEVTSTGSVSVGWGVGAPEARTGGGREAARALLEHGRRDLAGASGPGPPLTPRAN